MTNEETAVSGTILRPRMPELDSIRGLATLGVFLYHSMYAQPVLQNWSKPYRLILLATWPGHFGVNLFFVLSGFLITGILTENRFRQGYFTRFYNETSKRSGVIARRSCVAPQTHANAEGNRSSASQNQLWSDATDAGLSGYREIASLRIGPLGRGRLKAESSISKAA
jgi:hypothetical protein